MDEELYERARGGCKASFNKLYVKYEKPIFGFVSRRVNSVSDAEEIFHDTMIAIFKGPKANLSHDGAFSAWLYKVAKNFALNRIRSQQREGVAKSAWATNENLQITEHTSLREERIDQMNDASQNLSKGLRDVYDERMKGLSYEEISQKLCIPDGTVKSRMNLMVSHLRKEISKWSAK